MIVQAQLGGGSGSVIGQFAWLLAGNDTAGVTKILGTTSNDDVAITTSNITRGTWFKSGEWGIGISSSPLGTLHVKGLSGQSPLYVQNNSGTASLEYRDAGSIYRNGIIYSANGTAVNQNTTWGYNAGSSITFGGANTLIGYTAGQNITTGSGITMVGAYPSVSTDYGTGTSAFGYGALQNATGGYNTAIGREAGRANTTGVQNMYLGSYADVNDSSTSLSNLSGAYNIIMGCIIGTSSSAFTGGNAFNSVWAVHGIGTASNQIVFGGGSSVTYFNSLNVGYSSGGASHATYFRTSTPESNQIGNPGDKAQVNNGTDGEEFIKTAGTGDTGWGQVVAATAVTTEVLVPDTSLTIKINGTTYKILARA